MNKRTLTTILSSERIHDHDEFHECPLAQPGGELFSFDDWQHAVTCGQGGYGLNSNIKEWTVSFFHKMDKDGVDTDTYVLPPYLSSMINFWVINEKNDAIRNVRASILEALGIKGM